MSGKLTKAQREMLGFIADPIFRLRGILSANYRELTTARALARRGLATLDHNGRCIITPAGREALEKTDG